TENADVQRYAHALVMGDSTAEGSAREGAAAFLRSAWKMDSVSYYTIELHDARGAPIVRLINDLDSAYVPRRATITSAVRDVASGRHPAWQSFGYPDIHRPRFAACRLVCQPVCARVDGVVLDGGFRVRRHLHAHASDRHGVLARPRMRRRRRIRHSRGPGHAF